MVTLTRQRDTSSPAPNRTAAEARPELYVVATHKVRDRSTMAPQGWLPYGLQHAWRAGTRSTLCGQFISGWTVFWERSFSARSTESCPDCVESTLPEAARARLAPRRIAG